MGFAVGPGQRFRRFRRAGLRKVNQKFTRFQQLSDLKVVLKRLIPKKAEWSGLSNRSASRSDQPTHHTPFPYRLPLFQLSSAQQRRVCQLHLPNFGQDPSVPHPALVTPPISAQCRALARHSSRQHLFVLRGAIEPVFRFRCLPLIEVEPSKQRPERGMMIRHQAQRVQMIRKVRQCRIIRRRRKRIRKR